MRLPFGLAAISIAAASGLHIPRTIEHKSCEYSLRTIFHAEIAANCANFAISWQVIFNILLSSVGMSWYVKSTRCQSFKVRFKTRNEMAKNTLDFCISSLVNGFLYEKLSPETYFCMKNFLSTPNLFYRALIIWPISSPFSIGPFQCTTC